MCPGIENAGGYTHTKGDTFYTQTQTQTQAHKHTQAQTVRPFRFRGDARKRQDTAKAEAGRCKQRAGNTSGQMKQARTAKQVLNSRTGRMSSRTLSFADARLALDSKAPVARLFQARYHFDFMHVRDTRAVAANDANVVVRPGFVSTTP